MGLALPLRPRSAFRLTGVLPSASRPCRPHFFVAPHPATPNNKKRLPFGNLLLLLERAMGFGPTTSTLATKKIIPKVAVMGILSRYFYGYWYVFAHRRHYQLWYRFQYILDFCTIYIWQLDPVLLYSFVEGKDISYIKHFCAGLLSDYRWCLL